MKRTETPKRRARRRKIDPRLIQILAEERRFYAPYKGSFWNGWRAEWHADPNADAAAIYREADQAWRHSDYKKVIGCMAEMLCRLEAAAKKAGLTPDPRLTARII